MPAGAHRTPHPSAPGGHCQPAAPSPRGAWGSSARRKPPGGGSAPAAAGSAAGGASPSSLGSGQNLGFCQRESWPLPRVVTAGAGQTAREKPISGHAAAPRACTQAPGQARPRQRKNRPRGEVTCAEVPGPVLGPAGSGLHLYPHPGERCPHAFLDSQAALCSAIPAAAAKSLSRVRLCATP